MNACSLAAPDNLLNRSGKFLPLIAAFPHGGGHDWWLVCVWSLREGDNPESLFAASEPTPHTRYCLPLAGAYAWWRKPDRLRVMRYTWNLGVVAALWGLVGRPQIGEPGNALASRLLPTRNLPGAIRWDPLTRHLQVWLKL